MFYPSSEQWSVDSAFTPAFTAAYARMVQAESAPAPQDRRLQLVRQELDATAPTLVANDLTTLPEAHRAFARRMLPVAELIDALYARQVGMTELAGRVAADENESKTLFRRNWGAACRGASTEHEEDCSAIAGSPRQPVDVYPAALQASDDFCQTLEAREDAESLLTPFTVVREREGTLVPVPYTEVYGEQMAEVATELRAAADALSGTDEEALRSYLGAAAQAFTDNNWEPADEAWSRMNARNSKWYIRVGPDETYWDPCSHHAAFHLTLALINRGSLEWQDRLSAIRDDMEASFARLVETYDARPVSFHLPDFIDIAGNAGDDRNPFGATIGQSLPNWGAVAEESRGRTVVMSNLYTDSDSVARARQRASTMFSQDSMARFSETPEPGLLNTILHEASHNLGPSHEYEVDGRNDRDIFGGGLASMLEELKAQTGGLYLLNLLRERDIISEQQHHQAILHAMIWATGHISRGMYTATGQRKAYSQLAAIHVGFLMNEGVLRYDPQGQAANGTDAGAFTIDFAAFPAAIERLMVLVMRIKSTGDRAAAEELANRYVDGDVVPQPMITERSQRFPRATLVYSLEI
jgi:hypothetical protein